MSGSPIYLKDEAGKDRMIGAFAYGWPLSKDPIAGVQPIEYMLEIPTGNAPATQPADEGGKGSPTTAPAGLRSPRAAPRSRAGAGR
jgi:hypothetical protein